MVCGHPIVVEHVVGIFDTGLGGHQLTAQIFSKDFSSNYLRTHRHDFITDLWHNISEIGIATDNYLIRSDRARRCAHQLFIASGFDPGNR